MGDGRAGKWCENASSAGADMLVDGGVDHPKQQGALHKVYVIGEKSVWIDDALSMMRPCK